MGCTISSHVTEVSEEAERWIAAPLRSDGTTAAKASIVSSAPLLDGKVTSDYGAVSESSARRRSVTSAAAVSAAAAGLYKRPLIEVRADGIRRIVSDSDLRDRGEKLICAWVYIIAHRHHHAIRRLHVSTHDPVLCAMLLGAMNVTHFGEPNVFTGDTITQIAYGDGPGQPPLRAAVFGCCCCQQNLENVYEQMYRDENMWTDGKWSEDPADWSGFILGSSLLVTPAQVEVRKIDQKAQLVRNNPQRALEFRQQREAEYKTLLSAADFAMWKNTVPNISNGSSASAATSNGSTVTSGDTEPLMSSAS